MVLRFMCSDHYGDVIMGTVASQLTNLTIIYSTFYSSADQSKHQSSASLAYVWGMPVNSPHKWPITRKLFPFDDVIMFRVIMITICIQNLFESESEQTACHKATENNNHAMMFVLCIVCNYQNDWKRNLRVRHVSLVIILCHEWDALLTNSQML